MSYLSDIPETSPERIITLRDSSFATDLFITAVSYFDFFNWLADNPADIDTICDSLEIQKRPADVMLTLFKAYGFIEEKNRRFFPTNTSRAYLNNQSNFDLTSYVDSLKDRPVCADMLSVLKTGKPANWAASKTGQDWATSMEEGGFAESFTAGMNSRGAYLASGLVKSLDLSGYSRLLDIGGGSGIYSVALAEKYPGIQATVFEKPPVDRIAQYSIQKFNMNKRISVMAGDMFRDELPEEHDCHLLSHVLHDWDINEVETLLANSFRNLKQGGMIVIHDAHINEDKNGPISIAEYSVLLMFLSEGKCYSITETKELLEKTGFQDFNYTPTIFNRSIITAKKT